VFQVAGAGYTQPDDCCAYLVHTGGEASVLIDAGLDTRPDALLANIAATGLGPERVAALVLTHCHIDHIGGAPAIRELTGCEVVAHEGDAEAIRSGDPVRTAADLYGMEPVPVEVDRVVEGDGAILDYGRVHLVVVHTPGHTPGNITLRTTVGGRTLLFANDVHGPFSATWGSDVRAWKRSMNRLVAMSPDILLEGHYGVQEPRAKAIGFIQTWLGHHQGGA
jgi:metallo-beta-lactamase class B